MTAENPYLHLEPKNWIPAFREIVTPDSILESFLFREADEVRWGDRAKTHFSDIAIALGIIMKYNAKHRDKPLSWSERGWREGGADFLLKVLCRFADNEVLEEKRDANCSWWGLTAEGRELATS